MGIYGGWGSVAWQPLAGLNDADDSVDAELDFVGDANNPAAYWAADTSYVYVRMRVDLDSASAANFSDTHMVLIDVDGYYFNTDTKTLVSGTDIYPDYGFAWDSKSNDVSAHGLEMMIRSTVGANWNDNTMDDIDLNNAQKLANDINGASRTTDGYVRVTDGIGTTAFGTSTFIDFAVSWGYLTTYTALRPGQTWKIGLASISNATDHNALGLGGDIAGGAAPGSTITTGWSSGITPVPEPTSAALALCLLGVVFVGRRRRS